MPTLCIIAGPNGNGKTTLAKEFAEEGLDFLNTDEIAKSMNPQICIERIKNKVSTILLFLACLCITAFAQQQGSFTDSRNDKIYKTVKIGAQIWMAENLNYATSGSKCYNDSSAYCKKYGRLYEWGTAMRACPKGWHLPSDDEWEIFIDYIGGRENAGTKLKASGWYRCGSGGSYTYKCDDTYGFAALPGGYSGSNGDFSGAEYCGLWWSASENDANYANFQRIYYFNDGISRFNYYKSYLFSVRCLQE